MDKYINKNMPPIVNNNKNIQFVKMYVLEEYQIK